MKKPQCHPEIYRMPPTKHFPKGLRVRKAIGSKEVSGLDIVFGTLVVSVRDGRIFYTNEKLIKE